MPKSSTESSIPSCWIPASAADVVRFVERHRLGDLEAQRRTGKVGFGQCSRHATRVVGVAELGRRHVDGHAHCRRPALAPELREIDARGPQNPRAQLLDQAHALGERDEHRCGNVTPARMVPTGERLDADTPAGREVVLRLIDNVKMPAVYRRRGVGHELELHAYRVAEIAVVDDIRQATFSRGARGTFGEVHDRVGALTR